MDLNPEHPFEAAVMRMVEMNRRKGADYASGDDIFLNFRVNAQMMRLDGYDHLEDCLSMVCRKVNRITNLRGRDPQNETVIDSYEDLAVYATLLFAMALEKTNQTTVAEVIMRQAQGIGIVTEVTQGVDLSESFDTECYNPEHKNCTVDRNLVHHQRSSSPNPISIFKSI